MLQHAYHPLYLRGIEQFNRCDFFQSHDVWEELWLEVEGEDRLFFKGLIQAAVALFHLGRGNVHGARKLVAGAHHYLGPFRSRHMGLDLDAFLAGLGRCVDDALVHLSDAGRPVIDPKLIPEIRLEPAPQQDPNVR